MKKFYTIILASFLMPALQAQKVVQDCTIVFDVNVIDRSASDDVIGRVSKAVKTSYVSRDKSRNDFVAPDFKEVTFFDDKCDTITILRDVGAAKSISYIETTRFGEKVKLYDGVRIVNTSGAKKILGYECRMAQAQFPDGKTYQVYYTPTIQPSHKAFEQEFKDIPGLVLEYEAYNAQMQTTVKYTAVWIDFAPVETSFFKIPSEDYMANK